MLRSLSGCRALSGAVSSHQGDPAEHAARYLAMIDRVPFDQDAHEQRVQAGRCFICALAAGDSEYRTANEMIYEDEDVLVFLNRYPTMRGYTLVCPRRHVERLVDDLAEGEYVALQRWVYRVGRAIEAVVPTERLYVLSLGIQQGNRHVHWHVAPLPPGVAYHDQQLAALMMSRGVLTTPPAERAPAGRADPGPVTGLAAPQRESAAGVPALGW